ncbi:MAG: glutathione synthase [Legionellaceae bacterium]|nr:glutathione synthase [Legionellaceae bacterium]
MRLAILMDAPGRLQPKKDTTVAMIKAATRRGWLCHYFTLADLYCMQGQAFARMRSIRVRDESSALWAEELEQGEQALAAYDIVLMRKDPPFNLEYIYATYALDLAMAQGVLVVNRPQSLRDANEKFFTLHFPQCCPETLVSQDPQRLRQFWQAHQPCIFKPLEGMGGSSVYLVDEQGQNLSVILENLTAKGTVSVMAQRYIPDIKHSGDKRILMVQGQAIPYGLARIPAKGELRGNLAAGARGVVSALTERERWICEQLSPVLIARGLYFVGLDLIGGYLTEINVTSPTCLREIEAETQLDIAGDFLEGLAEMVGNTPSV